ncbi:MAG: hypothetical protein QW057_06205 [Candidatus Bathyarchaeia archaeon]
MGITISGDWFVNPRALLEFYERYSDRPPDEIKRFSYQQGLALGRAIIEQQGIRGRDEKAIAAVLKTVLRDEPSAKILSVGEGRVLLRNSGFCPLMTACVSLNLPWAWLCEVLGWPFFHGLASAVDPQVNLTMLKRRMKGDPYCDHIFEHGEGKMLIP